MSSGLWKGCITEKGEQSLTWATFSFKVEMSSVNLDRIQSWIDQGRLDPTNPITIKELHKSRCLHGVKRHGVKLLARVCPTVFPPTPLPSLSFHIRCARQCYTTRTSYKLPRKHKLGTSRPYPDWVARGALFVVLNCYLISRLTTGIQESKSSPNPDPSFARDS
jgi:hypothetical protein